MGNDASKPFSPEELRFVSEGNLSFVQTQTRYFLDKAKLLVAAREKQHKTAALDTNNFPQTFLGLFILHQLELEKHQFELLKCENELGGWRNLQPNERVELYAQWFKLYSVGFPSKTFSVHADFGSISRGLPNTCNSHLVL